MSGYDRYADVVRRERQRIKDQAARSREPVDDPPGRECSTCHNFVREYGDHEAWCPEAQEEP